MIVILEVIVRGWRLAGGLGDLSRCLPLLPSPDRFGSLKVAPLRLPALAAQPPTRITRIAPGLASDRRMDLVLDRLGPRHIAPRRVKLQNRVASQIVPCPAPRRLASSRTSYIESGRAYDRVCAVLSSQAMQHRVWMSGLWITDRARPCLN